MLRLLHLWVGDGFFCGCRVGASQIIYGLSQETNMSGTPLSTECVTHRVPIPNEKCLGWPVRSAALSHCRVEDVNHSCTKAGARSRFVPVHQSLLNYANATIRSLFHFFAPRTDADWYHQHRDGSGVINVAPFTTSPLLHRCFTSEATLTRANSSKLCLIWSFGAAERRDETRNIKCGVQSWEHTGDSWEKDQYVARKISVIWHYSEKNRHVVWKHVTEVSMVHFILL